MSTARFPTVTASQWTSFNVRVRVGGGAVQYGPSWTCPEARARALHREGGWGTVQGPTVEQNDRHNWKHHLPATSLTGGKKALIIAPIQNEQPIEFPKNKSESDVVFAFRFRSV